MTTIPDFIMTIGIPGCGKSRWVKKYLESNSAKVVCPDNIRKDLTGDITNQDCNLQVWTMVKACVINFLNAGENVILDATNVNTGRRQAFLRDLPQCVLYAKVFYVDPAEAYARIKKDLESGIDRSNVPEEVVYRMHGDFLYTIKVIQSEGFTLL